MSFRLPRSLWREMIGRAQADKPLETCGLVAGRKGAAERLVPLPNAEKTNTTYLAEPRAQFEAFRAMRRDGLDMLGIYHSHPATEAYPSARDIELALYPDTRYLIVSLAGDAPVVRSFFIKEGKVSEEKLEIVEDGVEDGVDVGRQGAGPTAGGS